ncbi:type II toxin-antitoxin system RelE/ParE family toxin [Cysteiniphilum halobium]|uniref:type II toxin-antitoxin system RelE/ParE family toxin n=1 Tax=Cysteiniphilum halobium TaxID=2219059 RepID=UPI003F85A294
MRKATYIYVMNIYFYKTSNGREPVKEDINKLPRDEKLAAYARLADIEKYGFDFVKVQFKQIKGKLWEIKYKFKNQHRILYCCMQDSNAMVLLHYVKKKTQKLENKDKDIAEKRMSEVLRNEK